MLTLRHFAKAVAEAFDPVELLDRVWFVSMHMLLAAMILATASHAQAASRIKDLATFEGVRDNLLVGYGLVTGLQGTGDELNSMAATRATWT